MMRRTNHLLVAAVQNDLHGGTGVDLTIYLSSGAVRATAEIMFPMLGIAGYLQPLRFSRLGAEVSTV